MKRSICSFALLALTLALMLPTTPLRAQNVEGEIDLSETAQRLSERQ